MSRTFHCKRCEVMFRRRPDGDECPACGFEGNRPTGLGRLKWYGRVAFP